MASCDRETLVRYKRMINDGGGMDLAASLKYEHLAMELHSATQNESAIAERRENILRRGGNNNIIL